MMRISGCVMFAALVWVAPTEAVPVLNLLPATGNVEAARGETVGWGYQIVNDDPDNWLVISSLTASLFEHGTGSDLIFDFPILAPGASLIRPYVSGTQGLYEFTWDLTAPVGFVNSGFFRVGAELWDGDPFVDGQFASALPDFTAPYDITVTAPSASVPEPATLLMLFTGLGLADLSRRVSQRRRRG